MTDKAEALCESGHFVEMPLHMDFDEMDVAQAMKISGRCPQCGKRISLRPGHYEESDGVLRWLRPIKVN